MTFDVEETHRIEFRRHGGTAWGEMQRTTPFTNREAAEDMARRTLRNGVGAGYEDYQVRLVSTQYRRIHSWVKPK